MSNKSEKLAKDTVFSIKLSKKHPSHKMKINGVEIRGYQAKNYKLPKGTNLGTPEVKAWFIVEKAIPGKKPEEQGPTAPAAVDNSDADPDQE